MSKEKPLIICIVGESGTGKTYLTSYLEDKYGIPLIESRTTRPPRTPDERGHLFETEQEFQQHDERDMIAYTRFGEHRYCCLKQDVSHPVMSYTIDEYGMKYLKSHFSDDFRIFAVRMFADEHELSSRVTPERRARDKGKFTLSEDYYDYFIHNDYSDNMHDKYDRLYERIKSL